MVRAFGINPKVGGSSPPLSQNFDTFTRTSARVSKMNSVARAQLTFQMLTLLKKCLPCKCISVTCAKCRPFRSAQSVTIAEISHRVFSHVLLHITTVL